MIYLWMFLALCIVCVSGYIGQVLNVVSAVSSFFGMVILAALIYYFTMWLTGGNELVTGGNDSNLLIVFYVQIMPDDFVMQLHRF